MNIGAKSITLNAPGKINLTFEILGKRTDGYHEIRSVVTTIPLFDSVTIGLETASEDVGESVRISCDNGDVPTDKENTCFKAVNELKKKIANTGKSKILDNHCVSIHIQKRIPVAGGLGGSSTDAATVILGLNVLLDLGLSRENLLRVANRVGSDLGSFIYGGTTLQEGRGDIITPISREPLTFPLLLVFSPEKWECKDSYQKFRIEKKNRRENLSDPVIAAIKNNKAAQIGSLLYNDLELSENTNRDYVDSVKNGLIESGAIGSLMSGSGPTVYGIYPDNKTLAAAEAKLRPHYPHILNLKI